MAMALPFGEYVSVPLRYSTLNVSAFGAKWSDYCAGGSVSVAPDERVVGVDMQVGVAHKAPLRIDDYGIKSTDFELVARGGRTFVWDTHTCYMPPGLVDSAMIGLLEGEEFTVAFVVPKGVGETWLRYRAHGSKASGSWAIPVDPAG